MIGSVCGTSAQGQPGTTGASGVAARFLQAVLRGARLLSDEHFSVDGTPIEAWASMKSFRRKDGGGDPPAGRNAARDFRGVRRSNATHGSVTDADGRPFPKGNGQSGRLCYMGHYAGTSAESSMSSTKACTSALPVNARTRSYAPVRCFAIAWSCAPTE